MKNLHVLLLTVSLSFVTAYADDVQQSSPLFPHLPQGLAALEEMNKLCPDGKACDSRYGFQQAATMMKTCMSEDGQMLRAALLIMRDRHAAQELRNNWYQQCINAPAEYKLKVGGSFSLQDRYCYMLFKGIDSGQNWDNSTQEAPVLEQRN
jgi:hypothetical protein